MADSSEWISVDQKLPDIFAGKFRVKKINGIEMDAFFYLDRMCWITFYGQKSSYWWDAKGNHDRFDNVTHWANITKELK